MTLNGYKFKFSRNCALLGMFGRQQRLNEWRQTHTVRQGIVAHWKYFSTMYRLRWYCWAFLSGGRFNALCPIYHGCRALTFALARLSCFHGWSVVWCEVPRRKSLLESSNSESGYKVEVVGGVVIRTPLDVRPSLSLSLAVTPRHGSIVISTSGPHLTLSDLSDFLHMWSKTHMMRKCKISVLNWDTDV